MWQILVFRRCVTAAGRDWSKIKGATGWPRLFQKIYSLYPEYQIQRGNLDIKTDFLFAAIP